uniref:Zinc finger PHD-type domain-containing protein n=1 Tax=Hyaloperonospora arabidopsidis (strain Emoy2) TaxID=559515 RepID=M4C298_HYAAE
MARHPKTKGGSTTQPKRRKKASALGTGSSSPALSATSSSGSSLTASGHHRECEQCGNNALLEGVARGASIKSKSAEASTGCQICDFVAYRRSQRPCVQCARTSCDHFCEWCGKGFHLKCARLRDEDVGNPNGFCCHKCEAEQSVDGHAMGTHDKDKDQAMGTDLKDQIMGTADDDDVGSRCGSCRLPFAMTGREGEDGKTAAGTGFKVNQAVLVDNDEVLYNAVITEVDAPSERIKIHFTRWSKSFDDWYAMEDEHINESLACDCCNSWFHIGCLPPIKSSGRWKDSTYVCPRCIDDAREFHNDSRAALKAKAANPTCVTSNAVAKALKKVTTPKEGEAGGAKTVKLGKASSGVLADGEEGAGEKKTGGQSEKRAETGRAMKGPTKKKRKLTDVANASSVKARSAESASERAAKNARRALSDSDAAMPVQPKEFVPAEAILKISLAPSEAGADSSNDHAAWMDVSMQAKAKTSKTHIIKANAAASMNASATMHMSPERTIKVVSEAHSSPYKAAVAKIGASDEPAADDPNSDKHERRLTTSETSAPEQSKWHSSCNTVMSLLNSPSSSGTPTKVFKPTVTSLPMLNSADNQNGILAASPEPVMTMPANFQVYVKMEPNHGQFSLYPRPVLNGKSVQASRKEAAAVSTKSTKAATARQTKQCQTGAGGRNLSAFDILREVASQEIDEGAAFVKLKRERRLMGRGISTSTSKRTKTDVSTCPSNAAASPGRAGSPGIFGTPTISDTSQSPQTRDRIQMNSFVDLHFSIRKEMYLRFCRLEEEGMLTRDTAHLLRSLIYPTSERFQDLKFVYLVNKDVPSVQLTKRLLEAVPYPPAGSKPIARTVPHASSSAYGGRGTGGLPMSMKMFSAGLSCNPSPTGTSHMGLLPPPPGSTFLRLKPPQSDDNSVSRHVSGNVVVSQPHSPRSSASPVSVSVNTAKRSDMMMMEHLAPTSRRPVAGREGATSQQQQQQQQLLNSR